MGVSFVCDFCYGQAAVQSAIVCELWHCKMMNCQKSILQYLSLV